MTPSEIKEYIKDEMLPVPIIGGTEYQKVDRHIKKAIQMYNKYNSDVLYRQVNTTASVIDISGYKDIKSIVKVYTDQRRSINAFSPLDEQLIGVNVIREQAVEDFIIARAYYETLKMVLGVELKWKVINGKLYIDDIPQGTTCIVIQYYMQYDLSEYDSLDIDNEDAINWIRDYALALTKIDQGRILGKSNAVDIDVQGSELLAEGKDEKDKLEEMIKEENFNFVGLRG